MAISTALLEILGRGRANVRSAGDLATDLGTTERGVGAMVADLIEGGALIGSSCEAGANGYFLIVTEDDLEVGTRHIRARALASLSRVSHLKHAAAKRFGPEALTLFEDQGAT